MSGLLKLDINKQAVTTILFIKLLILDKGLASQRGNMKLELRATEVTKRS